MTRMQLPGEQGFANDVATIVALLAVSGRRAEAERIAGDSRREKSDADFVAAVDTALQGTVPRRWPYP
jgi:hypothetical protein